MSNAFDQIAIGETLELKVSNVSIKGKDGANYKFTVTELTPSEMARCADEFNEIDFVKIIYRSVRDEDGKRMSVDQANRLPPEVMGKFIEAYNGFLSDDKKKPKKKKTKPSA